jgi:acyl-CoA synthetase (AMP-forming)/AMP-acid ligase II
MCIDPVPELPFHSIWQLLSENVKIRPDRAAIIGMDMDRDEERVLTYQDLSDHAVRCANYLVDRHGIKPGTHFSFAYGNRAEVLLFYLAGALIGASSVPLDSRRDVAERMAYKLGLTESSVLITHPRGPDQESWGQTIQHLRKRPIRTSIVEFGDRRSLLDEIAGYGSTPRFPTVQNLDSVMLTLFTSGTTADPKGVELTSSNLLFDAFAVQKWLGISSEDRFAAILPLHHINSITFSLSVLQAGGTLILLSEPPRDRFWEFMVKYQITITSVVQKMAYRLLDTRHRFEPYRKHIVLSRIQIGSDTVDPDAARRFIAEFKIPLYQGYGLTEISMRATGVPMDLPWDEYSSLVGRNSIGSPLAGVDVCIMRENGGTASQGEKGEICVRGPIVMKGYLKDSESTARAIRDGWFHTGDIRSVIRVKTGERMFGLLSPSNRVSNRSTVKKHWN